jgi:hypothetical protein
MAVVMICELLFGIASPIDNIPGHLEDATGRHQVEIGCNFSFTDSSANSFT